MDESKSDRVIHLKEVKLTSNVPNVDHSKHVQLVKSLVFKPYRTSPGEKKRVSFIIKLYIALIL